MKLIIFSTTILLLCFLTTITHSSEAQCGSQNHDLPCPDNQCCSRWGFCGDTAPYCSDGCQSQCDGDTGGDDDDEDDEYYFGDIFPKSLFDEFLSRRNDLACPARGFYKYSHFVRAAKMFPEFANTGDDETRKRELAAFFGQTSHETTGGWPGAPGGMYVWGYCFKSEPGAESLPGGTFCDKKYPCNTSFAYYGRGPMELTWNYNYYHCGEEIEEDLINNPNKVTNNGVVAFKTAIWSWLTPRSPKPSPHDVIIGNWEPTESDVSEGRLPGYGLITNIISDGIDCGNALLDDSAQDRIGFYKRYCDLLGIDYGDNLDCPDQKPFGGRVKVQSM